MQVRNTARQVFGERPSVSSTCSRGRFTSGLRHDARQRVANSRSKREHDTQRVVDRFHFIVIQLTAYFN
jgi:hypothetical protein